MVTDTPKILKNKLFLYLTEFFAGMSVMAVELGASRLLAPYFSSSQIVWTIIIGTIMIAMALGNIYGGRSADKNPDPGRLYRRILIAALWIAAIPVLGKYIILGIAAVVIFSVNTNFLIIAAFAACMAIFVFPLFLLGTVTPSLAKFSVGSLEDSGRTVGTLGAFNTVGSIIGTFVPTFVTIPSVGTSVTFLIFAGILLALSVIYFISAGRGKKAGDGTGTGSPGGGTGTGKATGKGKAAAASVLFLACCVMGHSDSFAFWESSLTYEGESVYNYLQVKEDPRKVVLSTNVLFGVQSLYLKQEGLTGMYYDYCLAAPLMVEGKEPEDCEVLILGMGTGTYAVQYDRYFGKASGSPAEGVQMGAASGSPAAGVQMGAASGKQAESGMAVNIEGVEIDGKITALAREYFCLPEEVKVTTYDGRAFLNAVDKKYDVIMVDAYQDITIPFQMSSVEFFTLVKQHLTENGVMVVNMNMRGKGEGSINQYLSDTIASVFGQVYTVEVAGSTNRELFASDNPGMLAVFEERREAFDRSGDLYHMMRQVAGGLTQYQAGDYVLTDDKAPVELLGMRVIDGLIEDEAAYYKEIFRTRGLKGLLESF